MPRKIRVKAHRRKGGTRVRAHGRVIKVYRGPLKGTKRYSKKKDRARRAMRPGKRESRRGKVYYERRRNRADRGKYL